MEKHDQARDTEQDKKVIRSIGRQLCIVGVTAACVGFVGATTFAPEQAGGGVNVAALETDDSDSSSSTISLVDNDGISKKLLFGGAAVSLVGLGLMGASRFSRDMSQDS